MAGKNDRGMFFEQLPGRDTGLFAKAAMTGATEMETGITGNPTVGAGGSTPSGTPSITPGNLFGTGTGKKSNATKRRELEHQQLQELLGKSGMGKSAAASPTDWDGGAGQIPTGFHRPTREQPEALEAGGERFHALDSRNPEYDGDIVAKAKQSSLQEGRGMKLPATAAPNAKHASVRFLGTSFDKSAEGPDLDSAASRVKSKGSQWYGQAKSSIGTGFRQAADAADEGVNEITQSPLAATAAAALLGRYALGRLGGVAKGIARLGRKPAAAKAGGGVVGWFRKAIHG